MGLLPRTTSEAAVEADSGRRRSRRARRRRSGDRSDRGVTLVEIAVATTVLAVTAIGIMDAMISGVNGSTQHQAHATATAWLHSAADHLEISPMEVCGTAESVGGVYQEDIRANVANSDDWPSENITITDVQFWNGTAFGPTCYDDLQLVTLVVHDPDSDVIERTTLVKASPYVALATLPVATDSFASCTFSSFSVSSDKTGIVTNGPSQTTVALKKPSDSKVSKMKDEHIRVTVVTTGNCTGKLRIRYQYPHNDHFHTRNVDLKLLKGTTDTYVGKFGGGKYYRDTVLDLTLQQGRTKSKTWGTVIGGLLDDRVKFV